MPRANRRRREAAPLDPGRATGHRRVEEHADGDWVVRAVPAAAATKSYRCPGCEQEVPVGVPHVVGWPLDSPDDRRHWHRACWQARHRRGPSRRR